MAQWTTRGVKWHNVWQGNTFKPGDNDNKQTTIRTCTLQRAAQWRCRNYLFHESLCLFQALPFLMIWYGWKEGRCVGMVIIIIIIIIISIRPLEDKLPKWGERQERSNSGTKKDDELGVTELFYHPKGFKQCHPCPGPDFSSPRAHAIQFRVGLTVHVVVWRKHHHAWHYKLAVRVLGASRRRSKQYWLWPWVPGRACTLTVQN